MEEEKTHFTKDQFKDIRDKISELFKDDFYKVSKSSYEWSSRNNWKIMIDLKMDWRIRYDSGPEAKLDKVSTLIRKVYDFTATNEHYLKLIDVRSRADFGFEFYFQPAIIVALDLLGK